MLPMRALRCGVSLESGKWAQVLWEDEHVSFWYAGSLDRAADISLCVPEAHFNHSENRWINHQLWGRTRRSSRVSRRIRALSEYLKDSLYDYVRCFDLDVLVIEGDEYSSSPSDPRPKFEHYDPRVMVIGNIDHENVSIGKAGRNRWLGRNHRCIHRPG